MTGKGIPRPVIARQRNIYIPGSSFQDFHCLNISLKHLSREIWTSKLETNKIALITLTLAITLPITLRPLARSH